MKGGGGGGGGSGGARRVAELSTINPQHDNSGARVLVLSSASLLNAD